MQILTGMKYLVKADLLRDDATISFFSSVDMHDTYLTPYFHDL